MKFISTIDELCDAATSDVRHVAESLGRLWRFGGQHPTASVLFHSLEVRWMCRHMSNAAQLWALWHDTHEILTGEVPRQHKSTELINLQAFYDMRLKTALGIELCTLELAEIDKIDTLCGDMEFKHWDGLKWQFEEEDEQPTFEGSVAMFGGWSSWLRVMKDRGDESPATP